MGKRARARRKRMRTLQIIRRVCLTILIAVTMLIAAIQPFSTNAEAEIAGTPKGDAVTESINQVSLMTEDATHKAKLDAVGKTVSDIACQTVADVADNVTEDAVSNVATEVQQVAEDAEWEDIGHVRITEYCPSCNDPAGTYISSSGKRLQEGYVACNWLPNGTRIKIDGVEYEVADYCGTNAIDIFCDTETCQCDANYYADVMIHKD